MILISDMNDTYRIRELGGTLVVTLPQKIVRELRLFAGDEVKFLASASNLIVIKPVNDTRLKTKARPKGKK